MRFRFLLPSTSHRARRSSAIDDQRCGSFAHALQLAAILLSLGAVEAAAQAPLPWRPVAPERFREVVEADAEFEARSLERLGADYRIVRTPHYAIAHHRESRTAQYRGDILEDLYAAFTGYFTDHSLALSPVTKRLPVIYTPTRELFVELTGVADLPLAVEGIYLHESGYALFFDTLGRREVRSNKAQHHKVKGDIDRLRRKINKAPEDARITLRFHDGPSRKYSRAQALKILDSARRDLRRQGERMTHSRGQSNLETMVHEAVHQLSFRMGVFQTAARPPRWLVEGVAMLFEPSANGYLLETGAPHWRRWAALADAHGLGKRIALADLLTKDELIYDFELGSAPYDEAWSLVHFLSNRFPDAFVGYLRSLRSADASRSPAKRIAAFERAFGSSVQALETGWREHVDRLGDPASPAEEPATQSFSPG